MTTTFSIVCTPIGNLEDLSARAQRVLRAAELVLAEDTRHTRPLLSRIGSEARLVSCHQHNEPERIELVIDALRAGQRVALVSDAGAPNISDPGGRIVAGVVQAGLLVEVIPGPSALVAALMGAGIDAHRFAFLGFLPRKGRARAEPLDDALAAGFGLVLFESSARVEETLAELAQKAAGRAFVVARELTKQHETFHRGVLGGALTPPFVEKGECVIVVEAGERATRAAVVQADAASPRARAKVLAQERGISVREAYALVVEEKAGERVTLAADAIADARRAIDAAARALVLAERSARGAEHAEPDEVGRADDVVAALARMGERSALAAPVEARDAARAVVAARLAMDALSDALDDGEASWPPHRGA